jgi:hypothetical protein
MGPRRCRCGRDGVGGGRAACKLLRVVLDQRASPELCLGGSNDAGHCVYRIEVHGAAFGRTRHVNGWGHRVQVRRHQR